jgi:hypothetical protein
VLGSKAVSSLLTGGGATGNGGADALSVITTLRKLCNHPDLLHKPSDAARGRQTADGAAGGSAAEDLQRLYPADFQRGDSSNSGAGRRLQRLQL